MKDMSKEELQAEIMALQAVVQNLSTKNGQLQGYVARLEVDKQTLSRYFQMQKEKEEEKPKDEKKKK